MNISKVMLYSLAVFCISTNHALNITVADNDIVHKRSGMIKQESVMQENPAFLNRSIPDQYQFNKVTVEIKDHIVMGEKEFGHPALEGFINLRHKSVLGAAGKTDVADFPGVKIGDAYTGATTLNSTKPISWIKEYWVRARLNAIFGMSNDELHTIRIGMFPHSVGRGIALGGEYGSSKDFLAFYSKSNDFSAPGVLLTGKIPSSDLVYKAYVGFLENKSSSLRDTLNTVNTNRIGRESTPWSGTGNNNTMYALSFNFTPIKNDNLTIEFEPYIAYNRALAQTVERQQDSENNLKTTGLNFRIQGDNGLWGADFEVAKNFGSEKLYSIDRNEAVQKQRGEDMKLEYSHIQESVSGTYQNAKAYAELKTELASNRHLDGTPFTVSVDGTNKTFRSAPNRIRPEYQNKYAGIMGVFDWFYKIEELNLVTSSAIGYFSGDRNPHVDEINKTYSGFVAMHEYYTGKYVTSMFLFDTRTIKRPLTLEQGDTALTDASLTDIIFGGYGFTWNSEKYKHKKLVINSNGLAFFKEKDAYRVDPATGTVLSASSTETDKFARKFLGTELNMIISMELLKNLTMSLKAAVFLPGQYYQDIKGLALRGDYYNQLDIADTQNIPAANYRLGNDTAYVTTFALDYRF